MTNHDQGVPASRSTGKRSEPARDQRTPPHSLEAERSALGAALVAGAAFDAVVAITVPEDYYSPKHGHIAAALHALALRGAPADLVTVSDQLRLAGLLELVGGPGYLVGLTADTPSVGRAEHYARIVRDTSSARKVIATAAQIADLGYSGMDPGVALDRAQALIATAGIASGEEVSTLEVPDLAALIASGLEPEQPALLSRSDGGALLYPGRVHSLQAEPSSGKTWVALHACAEVLNIGGAVGYLDYEDTAVTATKRLIALGVRPADVARFAYMNPAAGMGAAERRRFWRSMDELNPDLVVLDGVAEALTREGLSEDSAPDFVRWYEFPRAIARTGAAVLLLDHVSKDPEQRGRWARGTGAKLGAIDGAAYQMKGTSFSRHRAGVVRLIVAKDRPGGVGAIGETAAVVTLTPHGAGERLVVTVDPDTAKHAPTDQWRPTETMRRVFEEVKRATVPPTAKALRTMMHGKPGTVSEAIERLVSEGYLAQTGRTKALRIVKDFTEGTAPSRWSPAPPLEDDPAHMPDQLFDADPYSAEPDPSDTSWMDASYFDSLH